MTNEISTTELKSSLLSPKHWIRLVYMLLFAVMLHVTSIAMWVLVALQFLFTLFTDKDNANLRSLGASITLFISQALKFLTYNSEEKPFPFSEWPTTSKPVEETAQPQEKDEAEVAGEDSQQPGAVDQEEGQGDVEGKE